MLGHSKQHVIQIFDDHSLVNLNMLYCIDLGNCSLSTAEFTLPEDVS